MLLAVTLALAFAQTPRFEAVSIHLHAAGDRAATPAMLTHPDGTEWIASNYTARDLIMAAWRLHGNQVLGLPAWAATDTHFDVVAKLPDGDHADWREMVKTMLAERFALHFSQVRRVLPVFVLAAAPGGARLKPASDCDPTDPLRGKIVGVLLGAQIRGRAVTMDDLASQFAVYALPVVNETGLTARYDFDFETADGRLPSGQRQTASETLDARAAWLTAFQRQLGLVLNIDMSNPRRREIDVIQVTSVSPPTPN